MRTTILGAILLLGTIYGGEVAAEQLDRIETPTGTQPSGLAFYDGHFYMSSYAVEPGIYKIKASDGAVVGRYTPDIVWTGRYGGLAATPQGLVHVQSNNNAHHEFFALDYDELKPRMTARFDVLNECSDLAVHDTTMWLVSANIRRENPAPQSVYRTFR